MGLNWYPQTTLFLGLPCTTWGFMAIILAVAFSIILGLRLGNLHGKYFVSGAFLIITIFMFAYFGSGAFIYSQF